jgi:hypothetical protein
VNDDLDREVESIEKSFVLFNNLYLLLIAPEIQIDTLNLDDRPQSPILEDDRLTPNLSKLE